MHSPHDSFLPRKRDTVAWLMIASMVAVPLAYGMIALSWGMDASWDLRNYHYYNAYSFLTGRHGWDILAAQIPTFYNPLLDVPYYLAAQILSAKSLAFAIAVLQGLNYGLLLSISYRLLMIEDRRHKAVIAILIALCGVTGAGALSEIGTVFYDTILSLGVFISLAIIVSWFDRLFVSPLSQGALLAGLAGVPAGLVFGLKLPMVIFAIGLCFGLLIAPYPLSRRIRAAFFFGVGVLLGLAAAAGPWMWHLWTAYGNPIFPYFNSVFQSPWGLPVPYRDEGFLPHGLIERFFFLIAFTFDSRQAAEISFQDFRLLAAFAAIAVALIAMIKRYFKPDSVVPLTLPAPSRFILAAVVLSYGVWLWLFCIYRYIIPLEMIAPLVVAVAVGMWPCSVRTRLIVIVTVLIGLMASTRTADWLRVPFSEKSVETTLPTIDDPQNTIVLLAGHEPLSFLIPAFPSQMRFLRIDSTFTNPAERDVAFNPLMQAIVAGHAGPIDVLFSPHERHDVIRKLFDYRLQIVSDSCQSMVSPLRAEPYAYCATAPVPHP